MSKCDVRDYFRHHTIQHYKHLLETNMEQADREKEITIEHLADIDRSD